VRRPRPCLPESSRASRPPSESGPPRGAPRFVAGRAPQYPPVQPARPYCLGREGRGLGPRSRLGSCGRTAGGHHAHIWGGSLPRRSGPRRSTFLDGAGAFLPEPTATKHHRESSHDHRPLGQLLVPRRPSIKPLPRRSPAHGGHRRRPPVRRMSTTSQGQPTPGIGPLGVGDHFPALSRPRA
jgi:hypothetical protein